MNKMVTIYFDNNKAKISKTSDKNIFFIGNFGNDFDLLLIKYRSNRNGCTLTVEDFNKKIILNDKDWIDTSTFKDILERFTRTDVDKVMNKSVYKNCLVFENPLIKDDIIFYTMIDDDCKEILKNIRSKEESFVEIRDRDNTENKLPYYLVSNKDMTIEELYYYGKRQDTIQVYNTYFMEAIREKRNIIPFRQIIKNESRFKRR